MTRKESIREHNINYSAVMTVVLAVFVMFLQGCATPARLSAVPKGLEDQAQVPGPADVRLKG